MGGHLPRFTQLVTTEASAWAPVCLTPEVTLPVTVLSCLQGALWPDFFKEQLTVLCGLCQMFRGWHICCQYYLYWLSECLLWKCCSYDISFVDAKEICHFAMPDYLHSLLGGIRENPRDGGAWWATIYGVTQSWTRLKWLSISSSSSVSLSWEFIDLCVHFHGPQFKECCLKIKLSFLAQCDYT